MSFQAVPTRGNSEGAQRAIRSEARLRSEGVRINPTLPVIEEANAVTLRSADEVAIRALVLSIVAERAGRPGDTYELGQSLLDKHNVRQFLTPKERKFMDDRSPSERSRVQMSWRIEAAVPLMWALNLVPALDRPGTETRTLELIKTIRDVRLPNSGPLKMRTKDQILDEADLIYRYHWAVKDARISGRPGPMAIDAGIVQERHHALNWLINYENQSWDDVTTDT